jgi:agmatine/peptidylarginine deiminase
MTSISRKILPAEWAEQQFIQLTWPHLNTDWVHMLDEVNECFVQIVLEVLKHEKLLIVCVHAGEVKALLGDTDFSKITFADVPTNDTWARDHGGITVLEDGKPVIYDFTFNGWGLKFESNLDNQITRTLYEKGFFGKHAGYRDCLDFVLEGGSIESDGEGTLLTTSACLLSKYRNDLSKPEIDARLKELFGLNQVLWLNHGYLAGDDTDSHIDTLARLCNKDTIAYVQCNDETDEHFNELRAMEQELQTFQTLSNKPYNLIPLPMADAVYEDGERLPATYANFLIINDAVLMPTYNSPRDNIALKQLQIAFPDRKITGVNCLALIKQHGSLHCVTMQYPEGKE